MAFDRNKALQWLNGHWNSHKDCPICAKNSWHIAEEVLEIRPYSSGNMVLGGNIYPYFTVTCTNCGHTYFFNAALAKAV